jgi:anti-sigma factor RsiW
VNCHDARLLIDSYVDRELTAADTTSVRAHLETCRNCARLATERTDLARVIRGLPYYAAPVRLRTAVLDATRRPAVPAKTLAWAAAIAVVASLGTITGITSISRDRATRAIADNLVADHVRALREQHLTDVRSDDRHTVKPWFQGKIDFAPPVNDLTSAGFTLVGGRLGRIDGRTVAVLVYQRRLHPIAVFVWPEQDARTRATDARVVRGFQVRHWSANGMAFWAVSDMNDAELGGLVRALQ